MIRRSGVPHAVGEVQPTIHVKPLSIEKFVDWMQPGFAFARISDGGFFCILGRKGVNCDNSPYSPEQAKALIAMMEDKNITHGITSIALHATKASQWLTEKQLEVDWYDADVMNKASDMGLLLPFVERLRELKSTVVGAVHLQNLAGFPIINHIVCHPTHAFEEVNELEAEIGYWVDVRKPDCVLLSAGQGASPTLVSRLHATYPELIVIDCGSLWDPYVRVFSRSGHKKRGWNEYKRLGRLNFQEEIESWGNW